MILLKLLSISFAVAACCFNEADATVESVKEEGPTKVKLLENYSTSKNIMFSSMYGGTSHVGWVLPILEELSNRGHSAFFVTRDNQVKYSKDYPCIKTVSVGQTYDENSQKKKEWVKRFQNNHIDGFKDITMGATLAFKDEYIAVKDFIASNNIDIAMCDQLNSACVEAALSSKIPFIMTGTFPYGEDAKAPYINNLFYNMHNPTTEDMSLRERMHDMFIKPIKFYFAFRDIIHLRSQVYMKLGFTPPRYPDEQWKDSLKLINTAFGFEPARPLGPLMELIGPIVPTAYSALDGELESYLNSRSKVAYIAFGQHAIATKSDGRLLITALLESLEAKDIDGIIWAIRDVSDIFPRHVTTSSNTTYDIRSLEVAESALSNIKFVKWAPQMAVLQHPSTSFFITHGGVGSIYEAMYAGKRLIVYPFFGDQPTTAMNAEKSGIGLKLDRKSSQEKANNIVRQVAKDEDNKIRSNANRFKALIQIRSKHGYLRGADAVEEVLFTQTEDGKIPHRYPVSRKMPFMKANNYDIYFFLLASMVCFGYTAHTLFNYYTTMVPVSKTKTL